jgi:hypothetical protein
LGGLIIIHLWFSDGEHRFSLRGASNDSSILPFEFLKGKLGDYPILPLWVFDGEN